MTYGYSVFANSGLKAEPRSILRIEDSRGNIIEENTVNTNRVLDENVAYMISDVLSDNVARTPLWGVNSLVNFNNRDVAAKSGSTNNLRDAWIMGYTPNLTVGTWVGNNDNTAMGGGLSGLITTPMWREFMDFALETIEPETFPQPQIDTTGLKPILRGEYIDTSLLIQALNASNENSETNTEDSEEGSTTIDIGSVYSNIHSILHFVDKENPRGGYPANPASDAQYENWEYGVQQWSEETFGLLLNNNNQESEEEVDED
jgi:membrane peptidoglycan carboxypeptidase